MCVGQRTVCDEDGDPLDFKFARWLKRDGEAPVYRNRGMAWRILLLLTPARVAVVPVVLGEISRKRQQFKAELRYLGPSWHAAATSDQRRS